MTDPADHAVIPYETFLRCRLKRLALAAAAAPTPPTHSAPVTPVPENPLPPVHTAWRSL